MGGFGSGNGKHLSLLGGDLASSCSDDTLQLLMKTMIVILPTRDHLGAQYRALITPDHDTLLPSLIVQSHHCCKSLFRQVLNTERSIQSRYIVAQPTHPRSIERLTDSFILDKLSQSTFDTD